MKKGLLIVLFGWFLCTAFAENWSASFQALYHLHSDSAKLALNAQLEQEIYAYMQDPAHYTTPFPEIPQMGSIYSDDGTLRILSWNIPLSQGRFAYSTLFVKASKEGLNANNNLGSTSVALFTSKSASKPENKGEYYANNWYGALYYKAFAIKDYYILLGYSQYHPATQIKVIEVLDWTNERPLLGKAWFEKDNRLAHRVVFEYSSRVKMSIQYQKENKCLIFDHLSPEEPSLQGIYSYYGPDFSYDAYQFNRHKWEFKDDIDIKNE